jgi:hypothetical protein
MTNEARIAAIASITNEIAALNNEVRKMVALIVAGTANWHHKMLAETGTMRIGNLTFRLKMLTGGV